MALLNGNATPVPACALARLSLPVLLLRRAAH
jgi:hypothetical protein